MGQVWSKADFDGTGNGAFQGGRGSVLAVTAQNPGPDGIFDTSDDVTAPLNRRPNDVSDDGSPNSNCNSPDDRVRNFTSLHSNGAHFLLGDGSARFINQSINQRLYRGLSTINQGEVLEEF